MQLYFDGTQIGSTPDLSPIIYPLGTDFVVGQHGNGVTSFDFDGNLDEVRVYNRALSDIEIGQLSQGMN
jgi:hypothetical protein